METIRVVHLTNVDMTEYDKHLPAHRAWVNAYAERGTFLLAGALREARRGGCIIAAGVSESKLNAILAEDPFLVNGVATHAVSVFNATRGALLPALEAH